ncbi:MAG: ATP-binding protein [Chloroflexi bacterium]|nr:ATP-binding protein [Chloroflexota bacterium]
MDADRISQVAVNLVTNALRYAPSGPIHVRLRREPPGWATLEVRDTGPGIRPEVLARVWEKFYRGPEAMSSPIRGAGIGLTLVKTIAEAHGGTVAAESAPGNGATFRVSLPISPEICGGVEALDLASGRPAGTVQYAL